jgi:hypothetical protein
MRASLWWGGLCKFMSSAFETETSVEEGSRECARLTRRALIRRARRARLAHSAHSAAPAQPVSEQRESDLWSDVLSEDRAQKMGSRVTR